MGDLDCPLSRQITLNYAIPEIVKGAEGGLIVFTHFLIPFHHFVKYNVRYKKLPKCGRGILSANPFDQFDRDHKHTSHQIVHLKDFSL